MVEEITCEYQFYEWFQQELGGSRFDSRAGREFIEANLDGILSKINNYFTPEFMGRSVKATYFERSLNLIRKAAKSGDVSELAHIMDDFKSECRWA